MSLQPSDAAGLARFPGRDAERRFEAPAEIIEANSLDEVRPAMARLAEATRAGQWAAGFLAYEAAPALDPCLRTHAPGDAGPLLWFGLYDSCRTLPPPSQSAADAFRLGPWAPMMDPERYAAAIARIHEWIAAGDAYQVNFTFPMHADFEGDPEAWFEALCAAQRADHCAYIDTGRFAIVSASPELFFTLGDGRIRMRPMKGTCPRGLGAAGDRALGEALRTSEKNRAENVMIVDLLRNDLGRLAKTGTVRVESLFDLERYPTVWQLTSTIEAETEVNWTEALATLFPSGSVTGAPKIRTMEIIRDTEQHPRGVYCGAIGWAGPDGQAAFNVAIRTATVDRESGRALYPVGGGITWDSAAEAEFAECTHKARILTHRRPAFELLETMRFENGACALIERHLARMAASADYFAYPFERDAVLEALDAATAGATARVRLLLDAEGRVRIETGPLPESKVFQVAWSPEKVDARDVFLYHKTTYREVYDRARNAMPEHDDVLLINRQGEVTEGTIGNLVVELDGVRYTPPVQCGLLEGVFRADLLARSDVAERVLTPLEVERADGVWLVNAVRGWIALRGLHRKGTSRRI